jgi:DnaJ-class molecular chaperone
VNASLVLAVLTGLALWAGFLYVAPFGPCLRCRGTGHIRRGPRRRPVCPRCKGRRRVQQHGSRTVHRLARKVRQGRQAAGRYQEDSHEDS